MTEGNETVKRRQDIVWPARVGQMPSLCVAQLFDVGLSTRQIVPLPGVRDLDLRLAQQKLRRAFEISIFSPTALK
jgi:hypothetical protein